MLNPHYFTNNYAVLARFQLCDYAIPGELCMALLEHRIAESRLVVK